MLHLSSCFWKVLKGPLSQDQDQKLKSENAFAVAVAVFFADLLHAMTSSGGVA